MPSNPSILLDRRYRRIERLAGRVYHTARRRLTAGELADLPAVLADLIDGHALDLVILELCRAHGYSLPQELAAAGIAPADRFHGNAPLREGVGLL